MSDTSLPEELTDTSQIKWDLPGYLYRAIGRAVVALSRLEHSTELIIWNLLSVDSEDGKLITSKLETTRKQTLLKDLIANHPKKDVAPPNDEFWEVYRAAIEGRNKIAHGAWAMVQGIPALTSTKWKGPQKNLIILEPWPIERIGAIEKLADRANFDLVSYAERAGLQHVKLAQIEQGASPIPHPNPDQHP